jgi:plasmid stabilization system protein ParE
MVGKIIWSPNAISEYEEIVDFLMLIWNVDIILDFENLVNHKISMISKNPYSFSIIDENVRRVVIHKNVSLYYDYKEEQNTIEILSIFDNRQNPDKLKL